MISAVILAGGRGRRFQGGGGWVDKLTAEVGGSPIISRVMAAAAEVASEIVVAANSRERGERYLRLAPPGVRAELALDPPVPYRSPALGVFSGVSASNGDVVLVLPGDAAFISADALAALREGLSGGTLAAAPMWSGGVVETLFLALDGDWAREAAAILMEVGWRRPDGLLRGSPSAALLPAEELAQGDCRTFLTVNTRTDLTSRPRRPGPPKETIHLTGGNVRPGEARSRDPEDFLGDSPFWAGVLASSGGSAAGVGVGLRAFELEASLLRSAGADFLAAHSLKDAARIARITNLPDKAKELSSEAERILSLCSRGACEPEFRLAAGETRIS